MVKKVDEKVDVKVHSDADSKVGKMPKLFVERYASMA